MNIDCDSNWLLPVDPPVPPALLVPQSLIVETNRAFCCCIVVFRCVWPWQVHCWARDAHFILFWVVLCCSVIKCGHATDVGAQKWTEIVQRS